MGVKFAVLPAVTVVLFSTTDQGYREERHTYLHCDLHLCVGYITHVHTLSAVLSPLPVVTQVVWARQSLHSENRSGRGAICTNT